MTEGSRAQSRPDAGEPPGASTGFVAQLSRRVASADSLLCVGLDPDPARVPAACGSGQAGLLRFCQSIVDATAAHACAFKPQIAYFAAARAERELEELVDWIHERHPGIPVVLDAKRGDIDATARQYAREAFERYRADAVTVNPYMGFDSIAPYLEWEGRGVFVLCRTSNPGGSDLQMLQTGAELLYEQCSVIRPVGPLKSLAEPALG